MVPQWDLLNLLAEAAASRADFHLAHAHRGHRAAAGGGQGHRGALRGPDGPGELQGRIDRRLRRPVVDRSSRGRLRRARIPGELRRVVVPSCRDEADAEFSFLPRVGPGKALGVIPREGYYQIAYIGPKGLGRRVARAGHRGLPSRRRRIAARHAALGGSADSPWTTSSTSTCGWIDCVAGTPTGCCASATPRTRCPRSVASASTWRSRTPSRPRPYWPNRCGGTSVTDRDLAAVRRRRAISHRGDPDGATGAADAGSARCFAARIPPRPLLCSAWWRRLPWLSVVPAYFIGVGVRPERAPAFARRGSGGC